MPINATNLPPGLSAKLPIALFPVRLETRFTPDHLLIRIYPDTVHVDSFEPKLTDIEITWGKNFWVQTWLAGKNEARECSAWAQLAEKFGPARAAWIAEMLTPQNPGNQPESPIPANKPLPKEKEPKFHKDFDDKNPEVFTADAWTRAPHTQILPTYWIALGYKNGQREPVFAYTNGDDGDEKKEIPQPLAVSFSPEKGKGFAADDFEKNDEAGWLVNFEKARKKGMGLRIPYSGKLIDRLIVLGVNTAAGTEGQKKLEGLLQAHHHTQGLSFLLQGTPTNNTDDASSGYSTLDPGFEKSYRIERKAAPPLTEGCNRAVTARALGIDDNVFAHVREANAQEQLDAQHMNAALWQATWGYFLQQMMAGPNTPNALSDEMLRQGRAHFERYVRARGPLPTLRIGNQPYGLLPVISLDQLDEAFKKKGDQSMDAQLVSFLRKLREIWQRALTEVPQVTSGESISDSKSKFLDVLAMTPTSVAYNQRPAQRIALRSTPPPKAPFSGNQTTSEFLTKTLGLTWIPRQIRMVYGDASSDSLWPGSLIMSNLNMLKNPNFEGPEGRFTEFKGIEASSTAADNWTLYNNVIGTTTTKLVRSTFPYGGSTTMIHVTTTGIASGLVQTFFPTNAGPSKIIASAWVFVNRGHVGIGTGNGGDTHLDAISSTTGQWEYLEAKNGVSPANEFIIYSDNVTQGGADFYVAAASVPETLYSYCEWLMAGTYDTIWRKALNSTTDSLFHWLIREACLREYLEAACRILKLPNEKRLEPEWEAGEISELRSLLDSPVSVFNPTRIGDYLDDLKKKLKAHNFEVSKIPGVPVDIAAELGDFAAFFKSLDHLTRQPVEVLKGLLSETLDLCSHRYDAWVTSFATKRLEALRKQQPAGIHIGGYGWVENLERDERQTINPPADCEYKPASLYESEGSQGFIHAPSLAHATTAALLRSGYMSHLPSKDQNSFAVNLSSERVRLAQWLLDGVRQGQSLSALLGYRFERGLHENYPGVFLDRYILPFRRVAPLYVGLITNETIADQTINEQPVNQVVDGLALLNIWKEKWKNEGVPWGQHTLPKLPEPKELGNKHNDACRSELQSLEDAVDAINDLVIAESVHHVAQGNPVRAGATLTAIAEGEAPPLEMDVISTPRTGIAITHRIAVVFAGGLSSNSSVGDPWESTPRAKAEPFLNAWAARLFGPDAANAMCYVEFLGPDPDNKNEKIVIVLGERKEVKLEKLKLAPIDLLYLPESEGAAQRSELEQRIIYEVQRSFPAESQASTEIRLIFNHDSNSMSFAELLEVARMARKLITAARPLSARDFTQPDQNVQETDDIELNERAEKAVVDFKNAKEKLGETLLAPDPEKIQEALKILVDFGMPGAVPLVPADDTPEGQAALRAQAESVKREADERVNRINSLDKNRMSNNDFHVARLREVFGQDFRVLPRFTPANTADLRSTFSESKILQGGNPLESITWFQRVSRVREGAARLDATLLYAEALGGTALNFMVGQLPYKKDDRWAALSGELSGSRISLVVHEPLSADSTTGPDFSGLLVDEWVEVVPNKEEITGLTFHFNAPQSRAPQAILLAVAPDGAPEWDLKTLESTVVETLELAKLRAVDLSTLSERGEIDQFLPAVYLPQSRAPE
jgi:hypothetical protein